MKIYKIIHKNTGLYNAGGTTPRWTKKGKKWSSLGHLKLHIISQLNYNYTTNQYSYNKDILNWEVIEIEVSEMVNSKFNAHALIEEKLKEENDRKNKRLLEEQRKQDIKNQAIKKLTIEEKRDLGIN
jgi:hypothetical protein